MGRFSMAMLRRQRKDAPALAVLLRLARQQLGLNQKELAAQLDVQPRTLSRWEAGDARPTLEWREHVAIKLSRIDGETWRAIVKELKLPLSAMLEACPSQRPPVAGVDARARLDHLVRATAEDLDVTAKRLRAALGNLLADLDRLGLSPLEARELVLNRPDHSDAGHEYET